MRSKALLLAALAVLASCSSAQKEYDGKELALTSSGESTRPFWTMDGGYKIEKLRDLYNDDEDEPKNLLKLMEHRVK